MQISKKIKILAFLSIILYGFSSCTKDVKPIDNPDKPPIVKPIAKPLNILDPLYKDQWYLKNTGQTIKITNSRGVTKENKITPGIDINIEPVWKKGYFGDDIYVGILDSPVDANHEDLKLTDRIIYVDENTDCDGTLAHGTNVAGIIGAQHNNLGISGIAPKAKLISYGIIDARDKLNKDYVSQALNSRYSNSIAVYNNSWGEAPEYNYKNLDNRIRQSFETGSKNGFFGRGSCFVFAAGNNGFFGGSNGGTSNDPYLNDYRTIGVNAVSHTGRFGPKGFQKGTNIFITAPGIFITTTGRMGCDEQLGNYDKSFGATSAAAPQVSGVIALIRQARPELTWRDVKLILAESSKKIGSPSEYKVTGKMYSNPSLDQKHSMSYGFGLVDADAALEMALKWTLLPAMKTKTYSFDNIDKSPSKVGDKDKYIDLELNTNGSDIKYIENISLEIDFTASTKKEFSVNMDMKLITPDNKTITFFDENRGVLYQFVVIRENTDRMNLLSYQSVGSTDKKGTYRLKINQSKPDLVKDFGTIDLIKNVKIIVRGH